MKFCFRGKDKTTHPLIFNVTTLHYVIEVYFRCNASCHVLNAQREKYCFTDKYPHQMEYSS